MNDQGLDNKPDDDVIKELLLSGCEKDQEFGFKFVYEKYSKHICGLLRIWSNQHRERISADDLGDIWHQTMLSLICKVHDGEFTSDGDLFCLLTLVAQRRLSDWRRSNRRWLKRLRKFRDRSRENAAHSRNGQVDSGADEPILRVPSRRLLDKVLKWMDKKHPQHALVIRAETELFDELGRRPNLKELTSVVNRCLKKPLSRKTISNKRYSAYEILRKLLAKRSLQ